MQSNLLQNCRLPAEQNRHNNITPIQRHHVTNTQQNGGHDSQRTNSKRKIMQNLTRCVTKQRSVSVDIRQLIETKKSTLRQDTYRSSSDQQATESNPTLMRGVGCDSNQSHNVLSLYVIRPCTLYGSLLRRFAIYKIIMGFGQQSVQ